MLAHSIEYLGEIVNKGEVAIVIKLYDKSYKSCEIYDCRISLADGGKLDCWFGEIINLSVLKLDKQ